MAGPTGRRVCTTAVPMVAPMVVRIAAPRVRRTAGPTGLPVYMTVVRTAVLTVAPMVVRTAVPMAGLMVAQTADARR